MKLRSNNTDQRDHDQSLIVFCANYKKEKLEKIRRKYQTQNCLKCIRRSVLGTKKTHSTPLVASSGTKINQSQSRNERQTLEEQNLFQTSLSPISQRQNTEERIKREDLVRRNLFEKSLQAIIEEAKKELLVEKLSQSLHNDYIIMNANNNSRVNQNNNRRVDYVEDEVYEEILFSKQSEHFYEPVNFNIYEPINNFR